MTERETNGEELIDDEGRTRYFLPDEVTVRFRPNVGREAAEGHIARLEASAKYFSFTFDRTITKPVTGTISVWVNNAAITLGDVEVAAIPFSNDVNVGTANVASLLEGKCVREQVRPVCLDGGQKFLGARGHIRV